MHNGFWITERRLKAIDFPGQISLFTNLKTPVYFRNSTLDYIKYGGWIELPAAHYSAFMKALNEGWVHGERGWNVETASFTRKWRLPSVVKGADSVVPPQYVDRCKLLLDGGITAPFVNNSSDIPPQVITYITDSGAVDKLDLYPVVSEALKITPNKDVAHKTFVLLKKRVAANHRFQRLNTLNDLSLMNPEDRKTFMAWVFKSPEHLAKLCEDNWDTSSILIDAIKSKEIWYSEVTNENQKSVSTIALSEESAGTLLGIA